MFEIKRAVASQSSVLCIHIYVDNSQVVINSKSGGGGCGCWGVGVWSTHMQSVCIRRVLENVAEVQWNKNLLQDNETRVTNGGGNHTPTPGTSLHWYTQW